MPSIAQQDYIVIDCKGDDQASMPAEELNSIKEQLKRIADSNPTVLFSVLFKDYGDSVGVFSRVVKCSVDENSVTFFDNSVELIDFSFA